MAAPNRFEQFAQAPIVRPPPIERPEAIPRPGDAPARPRNRFQQFAPPAEAPQAMPPASADAAAAEPINPRMRMTGNLDMEQVQKALESAPPELRDKIIKEWEGSQEPSSQAGDIFKSLGTGLVKGAAGIATMPGTLQSLYESGMQWVGDKVGADMNEVMSHVRAARAAAPHTQLPNVNDAIKGIENVAGPLYKPQTTAGEYAQTVGEFVPMAASPGSLVHRAANVVAPAVVSETLGQVTKGTEAEPWARAGGAIVGAALPNVALRAATPFPITQPERARQAALLQREGVNLTAGDLTGRKSLRWVESAANDVPFSGQRIGAQKELQAEQFTSAALRRAGISNAPRATTEVIDAQYRRLGQEFETFAQRAAVPVTPQIANRVQNIARRYERITEPSLINPLVRSIADDILAHYRGSQSVLPRFIDGQRYSAWRSDIGAAARAASDPRTERALYDLQHILDNAAEQFLRSRGGYQNNAIADRMREARREYRNLLVVTKAMRGADDGLITPKQLRIAAQQMEGIQGFSRGRGDFTELAKAGSNVLAPLPNSGTPARLAAMGALNTLGLVGGALTGGPVGAALGAAGQQIAQGLGARAVMSRPVQRYLGNQTRARAIENSRARTPSFLAGLLTAQER